MRNLQSFLMLILLTITVTASGQDHLPGLNTDNRYVMGSACKLGIYITANTGNSWTITRSSPTSWLTPTQSTGTGQVTVYINFSTNPLASNRKDSITVTCLTTSKKIVFEQAPAKCSDYCCADCLSGTHSLQNGYSLYLPKKLSAKRTFSNMLGVNAGSEWDNFNGTTVLNPFKEVASHVRSFHQMEKDYPETTPCKTPGNHAAIACPPGTTNCWGVPTSTMAAYYHRYKFGWKGTAEFNDIHVALMAHPSRSFPNTWYTRAEWGSATDTSIIRIKAKAYVKEFAKNYAPNSTDCSNCDTIVRMLQVGNEPWGEPGRFAYHSILRGSIQGLSEYYGSNNPSNWRIKLMPAATQAAVPQHIWKNSSLPSGDYIDSLIPTDTYPFLDALNTHQYSFDINSQTEKDTIYPEAPYSSFHRIKTMVNWRNTNTNSNINAKPIWLTEFGWDSKRYNSATQKFDLPGSLGVGESAQAIYFVRSMMMLSRWGIDKATIYQSVDDDLGVGNADNYNSSGLVKFLPNSGAPTSALKKKSFYAMKKLKQMLGDKIYLDSISEVNNGVYAYIVGDTLGNPSHLVIWAAKDINNVDNPQSVTPINWTVALPGNMTINPTDLAFRLDYEMPVNNIYTTFNNSTVVVGGAIAVTPVPLVIKLNVGTCAYNMSTGVLQSCSTTSCTTLTVNSCPSNITVNAGSNVTWTDPTGTSTCSATCPASISGFTTLGDYSGRRYFKSTTPLSWDAAQADAVSKGGTLVCIETSGESTFINGFVGTNTPFFIGAKNDASTGNIFKWVNGAAITFNNWGTSEPILTNSRSYIVQWSGGMTSPKWFSENGGALRNYIIEIPCTANNTVTVARTDAGPLKGTAWVAGTYNVSYTLSNTCGCTKLCNFTVTVAQTCTPIPSITNFTSIGIYNNHKYYASTTSNHTWDQAQAIAVQNGGFLVSVESSAENTFIDNFVNTTANLGVPFMIGVKKDASTGNIYKWVNGSNLTFTNWAVPSEPNNSYNRSLVVRWSGMPSAKWFTENNGPLRKFIMEVPCPGSSIANRVLGSNNEAIKEEIETLNLIVYPNPVENQLNIILPKTEKYIELQVVDFSGKIIQTINVVNQFKISIDTRNLPGEIYLIKLINSNGTVVTKKFTKLKNK